MGEVTEQMDGTVSTKTGYSRCNDALHSGWYVWTVVPLSGRGVGSTYKARIRDHVTRPKGLDR